MALNYQLLLGRSFQDLDPVVAGEAALEGGECVGPIRYSYTLIHFVRHGRGVLKLQSGEYPVCAGQAFLILPGDLASYTADEADPWTYQWIGFSGSLAHDFAMLPPVFNIPENTLRFMHDLRDRDHNLKHYLVSDLFLLYAELITPKKGKIDYVQLAMDYIQAAYMQDLTVNSIADHLGLNRSYLSNLFSAKANKTIRGYILDVRYNEAKHYLDQGFTVKETSEMCGYKDPAAFSKFFKEKQGMSPKHWQQEHEKTKQRKCHVKA